MREALLCPQCGKSVPADAPQGLCPACMMHIGLESEVAEQCTLPPRLPVSTGEETIAPPEGGYKTEPHSPDSRATLVEIPGYEILGELGRGAMGVVYKARHQKLGRLVALKMILAGSHAGSGELARFRTEAEAIARLQHPNIVQIHEISEHEGKPYFSLEFCPGGSLAQKINGIPWQARDAAQLVETLARGMDAAHRKGVIHRDLKPGNVLLLEDGTPKITDFGLAKKLDEASQTQSNAVMGTPSYMAPEQAGGRGKEVGPAADTYALGAILYELLTGRPPFVSATALDTVLRVVSEEPISPRKLHRSVPRNLDTICLKCLEKEPRRRYASAQALADDLRCHLAGEPISARPPGFFGRLDRWARLRPALAATLVTLAFFYVNHLILLGLGTEGEGGQFHWFVTELVAAWACGAAIFQWSVSRTAYGTLFTYAWAAFDVLMFTLFLLEGGGPRSAMLPGYLLLIAGTALRLRLGLVWFVSGLCVLSYIGLLAEAAWRRPELQAEPTAVINFVLSLAVVGLIQVLLLRRLKTALAREP